MEVHQLDLWGFYYRFFLINSWTIFNVMTKKVTVWLFWHGFWYFLFRMIEIIEKLTFHFLFHKRNRRKQTVQKWFILLFLKLELGFSSIHTYAHIFGGKHCFLSQKIFVFLCLRWNTWVSNIKSKIRLEDRTRSIFQMSLSRKFT